MRRQRAIYVEFTMRFWLHITWLSLLALSLGSGAKVSAQAPDVRNIRPHVVLLVDTSGSMERKPDCLCTTPGCLECLPICDKVTPIYEQNRWSIVAEALTGEFNAYECESQTRIGGIYEDQYDEGYFLPHILLPHELGGTQSSNGVLDTYIERIKFGLMTFDSVGTLVDQPPLVTKSDFQADPFLTESPTTKGMYSYADDKEYSFPGSLAPYMLNNGARSATAPEGGLVTVGGDASIEMIDTNAAIQATILGGGLLKKPLRPYGATPTAALVSDLEYFLQNDIFIQQKVADPGDGDPYYGCRPRSAVLITDGLPNGDMRGNPVNCQDEPVTEIGCPYDEIADTVSAMIASGDLDKFYVIGFALDGLPAQVTAVEDLLNDVASVGDTDQAFFVADRAELVTALGLIFNEQNAGATSRTAPVLTGASPGLTESEFTSGFRVSLDSTDPWDGVLERRRFECVLGVPEPQDVEDRDRFQEVLTAQSVRPVDVEPWGSQTRVTAADFAAGGFSRNLWTVLPGDPSLINSHLIGDGRRKLEDLANPAIDVPDRPLAPPAAIEYNDVPIGAFNKNISPEYFFGVGSVDNAQRDLVVDWVHGEPGSGRENERLGDIYHSTPAIVGPLVDDIEDGSYNNWRLGLAHQESPDDFEDLSSPNGWQLSERPRVIYASTNDGIIHAFLADDYGVGAFTAGDGLEEFECANNKDAGTELWGFIPPMFLDDLDDLLLGTSKQWYGDGSIQVRNLYDVRSFPDADGGGVTNVWRTVLFLSFRNGGSGIVALDVTNPCKPEFLWQFTHPDLGDTYGQPTAAQVFLEDSNPTPMGNFGSAPVFRPQQSHGVILVPGGQGVLDGSKLCDFVSGPQLPEDMETATGASITPRPQRRCWRDRTTAPPAARHGKLLLFIDLMSGTVIRTLDENTFPAPLNGAVSVFQGDTGTVATAAYTVDAEGVLWRIDMGSPDPEDWNAIALHDMYYDDGADEAEPTYYAPVLSVDPRGNVVILTGTGNVDVLDDATAVNQVVSITEKLTYTGGYVSDVEGRLNWEIELDPGEQMTGQIELFAGQVFFGSFKAATGSAIDACPFGGSRIFGLSYLDDPRPGFEGDLVPLLEDSLNNPTHVVDQSDIPELSNSLLVGLQVAQAPICVTTQDITVTDPFAGPIALKMPVASSGREFKLMGHLSGSAGIPVNQLTINILEEGIKAPEGFTAVGCMAETLE